LLKLLETETNTSNPIKRTKALEIPKKPEALFQAEPSVKPSKPELPLPSIPEPIQVSEPIFVQANPELPTDLNSPEAKLDAIEAELTLKTAKPELPEGQPEPPEGQPELQTATEPSNQQPEESPIQTLEPTLVSPEAAPEFDNISHLEILAPAQLSEPEHLAADEPDVEMPIRASSRITDDSDADAPRPAIRIGFDEEDQSWRSVVTPKKSRPKLGRLVIIAVLIGVLIVIGGILLSQPRTLNNPNPQSIAVQGNPSSGSVVQFVISGNSNIKGRLIIVSAPQESQLAVGALLATVPGPVAFPVSGEYKVRIEIPRYTPSEVTVRVPQETQVTLELPR
jgi:hypothetical protein